MEWLANRVHEYITQSRKEAYGQGVLDTEAELRKKGMEIPPGVSKWKNDGIKWGYWKYFEKEAVKQTIEKWRQAIYYSGDAKSCLDRKIMMNHFEEAKLKTNTK
jgi:hypothetical protein